MCAALVFSDFIAYDPEKSQCKIYFVEVSYLLQ